MKPENIRNFCIIAHVDHGKSTLADRLLELTGTIESRRMRPQYLDQLELERERGITIKMAPVRMIYRTSVQNVEPVQNVENRQAERSNNPNDLNDRTFLLNLIDTPGHSDFGYEVSRALFAVEGAVLLVDVTKGIQAQTLSNFRQAKAAGLRVIGAVNKIDLLKAEETEKAVRALASLLDCEPEAIFRISGKTGEGVPDLLRAVVKEVPPPRPSDPKFGGRGLIFDSFYDDHKGILAYVRVVDGKFDIYAGAKLLATGAECKMKEVGCFAPELRSLPELKAGEIGYLATGFKEPALVKIGDTVLSGGNGQGAPLPGYREPIPVIFISFYPDGKTKFEDLKKGLERLRLTDAALSFEPDANEALGRGLKVGFLGQLHFEITASRLEREFGLSFLTSFPSIAYKVRDSKGWRTVKDAHEFPDSPEAVLQPMLKVEVLTPPPYLSAVLGVASLFQLEVKEVENIAENVIVRGEMPLAELIRDFDDQLKSASAGYASFSYELGGDAPAEVEKLEILIAGEVASALTRVVFARDVEKEGRATAERLKDLLPKQQFVQAIQARSRGRIIARETIPALKKLLGNFGKTGGDRTRKMKLWKKQKKGKERLEERGRVNLSVEVFREILRK